MTRVLVIDDSPTQAEEVRAILESAGLEVETAYDGRSGLDRFTSSRFDLVISDIVMPDLTGYQVCRRIKADPVRRETPVILLTTLGDPMDIVRALESGADNFIPKGQGAEHLVTRVRNLLETKAIRRARHSDAGVEIAFRGNTFTIASDRAQILDLLLATFEDIVRTNQALEQSQNELARKHEALVRAQRQREELSQLIVHDLKSPAAGIMMLARASLRRSGAGTDEERYWSSVLSSAEVINRMVMNLLDVSRSEDGALSVHLADVDPRGLFDEVVRLMTPLASEHEQRIFVDVSQLGGATIVADREMCRRILQNLVDNALRYGPTGGIVRLGARATDDGWVELTVADDGPGIPPDMRERVFDKYVRLESGKTMGVGRGLGLAFCRLAAEAQGARIWVDDHRPRGAIFGLRLRAGAPVHSGPPGVTGR
ncbi:hybrid sensor histidine kinase/response regulator [Myxococcota bacterium]|nr:hybrid sensor histidine kinase/response regulator [Myxococcota bacterium]